MEIINGILLILARAFVWGAVNLERPAVSKVEINQSDQMNESMNFLKRLKKPSAREESQSRRLNAYKSTMDNIISEIPDTMQKIEESYKGICQGNNRKLRQLDQLVKSMSSTVEGTNTKLQHDMQKSFSEITDLSTKINDLNSAIAPLEQKLLQNQTSLNELANDTQKVKESVGF